MKSNFVKQSQNKSLTIVLKWISRIHFLCSPTHSTSFTTIAFSVWQPCGALPVICDGQYQMQSLVNIIKLQLYGLFRWLLTLLICWRWFLSDFNFSCVASISKIPSKRVLRRKFIAQFWFIKSGIAQMTEIDIKMFRESETWFEFMKTFPFHPEKWTHYNVVAFYAWQWQLIKVIYENKHIWMTFLFFFPPEKWCFAINEKYFPCIILRFNGI